MLSGYTILKQSAKNLLQQISSSGRKIIADISFFLCHQIKKSIQYYSINPDEMDTELHRYAKELLDAGKVHEAWQVLLADV